MLVDPFDEVFYAIPRNQAILRCPIQPGALGQYYYGRWERDGNTLIEILQPINGNHQDVRRLDSPRYGLDRNTFSLIINSVETTDAGDTYRCILNVIDPRNNFPINLQTGTVYLTLIVNGKSYMISTLCTLLSL